MPDNFKITLLQTTKKNNHIFGVFNIYQTKKIYKILHNVKCASMYVIYLIQCVLCNKQCVGKAETRFNIRLNNHRKDAKKIDPIMACKHFQQEGHNFQKMQNLPLSIS